MKPCIVFLSVHFDAEVLDLKSTSEDRLYGRFSYGRYGVRAVIGKGGMGAKTLAGLKEHGAVYLNAIGGAAQFYARCITGVDDVSWLELGTPEAMWHLQTHEFPAIVTMDANGNSLHQVVEEDSGRRLKLLK